MGWRKSSTYLALLVCLSIGLVGYCQDFDEQHWQETIDGLEYGDLDQVEEEDIEDNKTHKRSSSWNFPSLGPAGQAIVIGAFVILLVILIVKLVGDGGQGVGKKVDVDPIFELEDLEENIHESDLERFLRISLEEKKFRIALRIYYLIVIRRLSDLGWIQWQKDKTNYDYVREMRPKSSHGIFRDLTYMFEIVWYGETPVSEKDFHALSPDFERFVNQLQQETSDESEEH